MTDKQQIRRDFLNRREVTSERIAALRGAAAPRHFDLLLDLLATEPLTELQAENALIYLFALRRSWGISRPQLHKHADLLLLSATSPSEVVRTRARTIMSTIICLSEESDKSTYGSDVIERFRVTLNSVK